MNKYLNNLVLDLATTNGVPTATPTNTSLLTKKQIEDLISANNPTTVSYLIKDAIVDIGGGVAASLVGDETFQIGDGVMAFDNVTVNGVNLTKYNIYRASTAGDLTTVVFTPIALNDEVTIQVLENLQYPGNVSITLFSGYVYTCNPLASGFDVWQEGVLILRNANVTSELSVLMYSTGTFFLPKVFPAGFKPAQLDVFFFTAVNGTVGTGSVSVGTATSPTLLLQNTELQSSPGFNLQQFSPGGYFSKKLNGITFSENTRIMITVNAPTGASTGIFTFRLTAFQ